MKADQEAEEKRIAELQLEEERRLREQAIQDAENEAADEVEKEALRVLKEHEAEVERAEQEVLRVQREAEELQRARLAKDKADADARLKKQLMDMEAIEKLTLGARDKRKVKEAQDFKLQKKADKVEVS